jgi:hypothetical protein
VAGPGEDRDQFATWRQQAVTWRLLSYNPARHAIPPPVPQKDVAALLPQQVDLLLDAATVRFRQELTNLDADLLPGHTESGGRRKELAVGPVESKASKAR